MRRAFVSSMWFTKPETGYCPTVLNAKAVKRYGKLLDIYSADGAVAALDAPWEILAPGHTQQHCRTCR
jgi:hypothetical protein